MSKTLDTIRKVLTEGGFVVYHKGTKQIKSMHATIGAANKKAEKLGPDHDTASHSFWQDHIKPKVVNDEHFRTDTNASGGSMTESMMHYIASTRDKSGHKHTIWQHSPAGYHYGIHNEHTGEHVPFHHSFDKLKEHLKASGHVSVNPPNFLSDGDDNSTRLGGPTIGEETLLEVKVKTNSGEKSAGHLISQYRKNEDQNEHDKNAVLMAKHFGTDEDYKKAKHHTMGVHNHEHMTKMHGLFIKHLWLHDPTNPNRHKGPTPVKEALVVELSKNTLSSYLKKSAFDAVQKMNHAHVIKAKAAGHEGPTFQKHIDKMASRIKGHHLAVDKLAGDDYVKVHATEGVDAGAHDYDSHIHWHHDMVKHGAVTFKKHSAPTMGAGPGDTTAHNSKGKQIGTWSDHHQAGWLHEEQLNEGKAVYVFHVNKHDSEYDGQSLANEHGGHTQHIGGDSEANWLNHKFPSEAHAKKFIKAAKAAGDHAAINTHPKAHKGQWHPKYLKEETLEESMNCPDCGKPYDKPNSHCGGMHPKVKTKKFSELEVGEKFFHHGKQFTKTAHPGVLAHLGTAQHHPQGPHIGFNPSQNVKHVIKEEKTVFGGHSFKKGDRVNTVHGYGTVTDVGHGDTAEKIGGRKIYAVKHDSGHSGVFDHKELTKLQESLPADASASDYIHDFVHSKNKVFRGDSKKQRIKRALGAYYAQKNESVTESVHVDSSNYQFTHGKSPRGTGSWFFSPHKYIDFSKHKEGHDYIQTPYGSYSEAKAHAQKWAKEKGHYSLHVQT